jgi:hypothetical protein
MNREVRYVKHRIVHTSSRGGRVAGALNSPRSVADGTGKRRRLKPAFEYTIISEANENPAVYDHAAPESSSTPPGRGRVFRLVASPIAAPRGLDA